MIDRLTQSLARICTRCEARRVWLDADGKPRVYGAASTYEDLLDGALDQIREAGRDHQRVLLRLAESLEKLAQLAAPAQTAALTDHLARLGRDTLRSLADDVGRTDVLSVVRRAHEALAMRETAKADERDDARRDA